VNLLFKPVNGTWTQWGPWSPCSRTCGEGARTRSRTCQEPLFGGQPCEGSASQKTHCKMADCCKNF